jgi:hypothetical protein
MGWRKEEIGVEIQNWPKLEELINSKDLIKLLTCLIDLFKGLNWRKIRFKSQLGKNWKN